MSQRNGLGLLILLAGSAVDSTSGVLTRLTHADGFTTASARGFLAFLFLVGILAWREKGNVLPAFRRIGLWGAVFATMNSAGMVLNVLSLKFTAVANFFMIFATAPFLAAVLGWLVLREKLDWPTLMAALAGVLGIAIMVSGGLTGLNLGDALALIVVCAYAVNVLILRKAGDVDILALVAATVLASGFVALPFADFRGLTTQDWGVLGALGFVQLGLGNILIFSAVTRVSAAQAGLLGIMGAVFAPSWVFLVLREVPPDRTLIGGAVILGAGLLHFFWTMAQPRLQPQE